jgi:mono/diheme cytochrome c family protein
MPRSKTRGILVSACLLALTLVLTAACRDDEALAKPAPAAEAKAAPAAPTNAERVARGQYLVTIGGCNDCHTPWKLGANGVPEPDMTRMLSGHPESLKVPTPPQGTGPWTISAAGTMTAWAGPWGITYTFNLTPDENTGIGIWTEEMFIKALRTGKHMGTSRQIQPPMPWFNYGKMTEEDLKSLYAYLRSIPPIKNRVPDYVEPKAAAAAPATQAESATKS